MRDSVEHVRNHSALVRSFGEHERKSFEQERKSFEQERRSCEHVRNSSALVRDAVEHERNCSAPERKSSGTLLCAPADVLGAVRSVELVREEVLRSVAGVPVVTVFTPWR